jgi:hypothetical protein
MKNGRLFSKICSELEQNFTVFSEVFLKVLLSVLKKFYFILFHLGPKSFGSHKYRSYLDLPDTSTLV